LQYYGIILSNGLAIYNLHFENLSGQSGQSLLLNKDCQIRFRRESAVCSIPCYSEMHFVTKSPGMYD